MTLGHSVALKSPPVNSGVISYDSAGASSKDRKVARHSNAFTVLGPERLLSVSKFSSSPGEAVKSNVDTICLPWILPCSKTPLPLWARTAPWFQAIVTLLVPLGP